MSNKVDIIKKIEEIEIERKRLEENLKKLEEEQKKYEDEEKAKNLYVACYAILTSNYYHSELFKEYFEKAMSFKNMINENIKISENKSIMFLHEAIKIGFSTMVDYFISKGADVNAINSDGYSPLILAIELNVSQCIFDSLFGDKLRLVYNEKLGEKNIWIKSVQIKNNNGINLEFRKDGKTALHYSAKMVSYASITVLHHLGANMDSVDESTGKSFLEIYVEELLTYKNDALFSKLYFSLKNDGYDKVIEKLFENSSGGMYLIEQVANKGNCDVFKGIKDKITDTDSYDKYKSIIDGAEEILIETVKEEMVKRIKTENVSKN